MASLTSPTDSASRSATLPPPDTKPSRVLSIDALRGFDMFWIIGGDALVRTAFATSPEGSAGAMLRQQVEHVAWEGFRFYDLIFPLFLFMVGCVLPYSLAKYADHPSRVYVRLLRRGLVLVLLGMVCNGLLQFNFESLRYAGVLQRIGVCYTITALIYVHTSFRVQAFMTAAILFGYWALMAWTPHPGGAVGDLSIEGNLAGWVDRQF
ncbi:MAG: heparan-alpha-glucosaminide N-acetyltransferase domain-containing protein, partial [Planctomycetota bacterium]